MTEKPGITLRKNEERRLQAGHLWVFSNEIDSSRSPLNNFQPGEQAAIWSSRGKFLGMAGINPNSLISARVYSYQRSQPLNADLLRMRITAALTLRDWQFAEPYYRLVNAEGDWLPGLVIDRYGDHLAIQTTTAVMEAQLDALLQVLQDLLSPRSIALHNNIAVRELEQLPRYEKLVFGSQPAIVVRENGLEYQLPSELGQKTGWYFDHRDSRWLVRRFAAGKRVLDACCFLGGWGLNCLQAGAESVLGIDASQAALDGAAHNAAHQGVADRWQSQKGEVGDQLRALRDAGERFDIVILDPPALIKRKKDRRNGSLKYQSINNLAVQLLTPGGVLVSCSCSHHMPMSELQGIVRQAGRNSHHAVQILARGYQGRDHPVHAAIPETEYLKTIFARFIA